MRLLTPPSPRSEDATGPGLGRARFALILVVLVALMGGCGPPRERFRNTYASPEALTEDVLVALEAEDRTRLDGLALSREEFQLEVFPEMPVYGNVPPGFAWSQLEARNLHGLSTTLDTEGGRSWELERVVFRGGRTAFQTFAVHRDPMLHLRDRRTGERRVMALFGSILETQGRFKLFSFNIDR